MIRHTWVSMLISKNIVKLLWEFVFDCWSTSSSCWRKSKAKQKNGWKSGEDKAGFTGTGGFGTRSGLHGHVRFVWSSKARTRHDPSHPSCHRQWCHLSRYFRCLRPFHQRNPHWKGTTRSWVTINGYLSISVVMMLDIVTLFIEWCRLWREG